MHLADYEYDEAQIHEISYAEISIQWSVTLRNTVRDPQFVWVCCELKNSEITLSCACAMYARAHRWLRVGLSELQCINNIT